MSLKAVNSKASRTNQCLRWMGFVNCPLLTAAPILAVGYQEGRRQGMPSLFYTIQRGGISVNITEAYMGLIEYTFNAFCRVDIHYAAINAWRDWDRRRQREISFEYLGEESFYLFSTTDKYFIDLCKQYPVTICGYRVTYLRYMIKTRKKREYN